MGIPLVVILAIIFWRVIRLSGLSTAFLATLAATITLSRMPTYIIVSGGRELNPDEQPDLSPARKESRWFLVLLFSLVAVILGILIYSTWSSL